MSESPKRLVWIRLPQSTYATFVEGVSRAGLGRSEAVELLLNHCGPGAGIMLRLGDTAEMLDSKLGVRLPSDCLATLEAVCTEKKVPISVYIRKLIYHFLVTKKVWFLKEEGHYTLAIRHDQT